MTTKITCVIVDDEPVARGVLESFVEKIPNLQLLKSCKNAMEAFQIMNTQKVDLFFLDINMPEISGLSLAKSIPKKTKIIFTTAYREYAVDGFNLQAVDYLLKPIDEDDLAIAVKKYQDRTPQKQAVTLDFNDIKKLLVNPIDREYKKRFSVKVGQHLKLINIDDIECFYSENKGTYLHTTEGRNYLLDTTLELLENELEPQTFYRINRKFFVNINAIKDMVSYTNSRLQIKLNSYKKQEIIVASERVKSFKIWVD